MSTPDGVFHSPRYREHNSARLRHLAGLLDAIGWNADGQHVLELGAGIGDHTEFWLERGARVTALEARPENVELLARRYPAARAIQADLNDADAIDIEPADIVYAYGVLYHLADPIPMLDLTVRAKPALVLLETCVAWGEEDVVKNAAENAESPSQALDGRGCRPTRAWIWRELSARLPFVYQPRTRPDHAEFPAAWTGERPRGLTRAIFVASREPIENSLLSSSLVEAASATTAPR